MKRDLRFLQEHFAHEYGDCARVFRDENEGLLCLIPTLISACPIVLKVFDDGWFVLTCSTHTQLELTESFEDDVIIGLVKEIIEGRFKEIIARKVVAHPSVYPEFALADGIFSSSFSDTTHALPYTPEGERIAEWTLPNWRGNFDGVEVNVLCSSK
ncbi:MAG: hypothetical protein LBC29_06095 [Propionibacteriaceae bacterium]|jgi:hypothetical protein|nr:hypothetical protein [Propionibacteriaceae bacterium]